MPRKQTNAPAVDTELASLQRLSEDSGLPYTSIRDLALRGHLPIVRFPGSRRIWARPKDFKRLIEQSVERLGQ